MKHTKNENKTAGAPSALNVGLDAILKTKRCLMSVAKTMVKIAELPAILKAAQVLERNNLLLHGESAADVVKRYVEANPDINEAIARSA